MLFATVEDKVKRLFDSRRPHLEACLWIHDPEVPRWMRIERTERPLPLTGATLHYAALWGLHTIVKFLVIERLQDVQDQVFLLDMVTPLHLAAKRGHVEVACFLLECGANVTAWDKDGLTPLHLASREGQLQVACILLKWGASVTARDQNFLTPLHLASREGQLQVTRILIDHNADVSAQDKYWSSPLHLASRAGQLEVARILIDHGADVDAQDENGLTPLHLALREG
jgi:ankyrin